MDLASQRLSSNVTLRRTCRARVTAAEWSEPWERSVTADPSANASSCVTMHYVRT